MYIVATFEHNALLEIALSDLEVRGIGKEQIVAAPLSQKRQQMQIFDTIHRADGISVLDSACIFGTLVSVVFTVYGYVWYGGPLIWGLFGLFLGSVVALAVDYILSKRDRAMRGPKLSAEVVIIVRCKPDQAPIVEQVFQQHLVLGITRLE